MFEGPEAIAWETAPLGSACDLLPSKSIALAGDTEVQAITTACLTESGFVSKGVKRARMWAKDAAECLVSAGEVLIARSNTPELVGRVSMYAGVPADVVASDLTIRIWPRDGVGAEFLTAYLSYLYRTGYWRERAGGASGYGDPADMQSRGSLTLSRAVRRRNRQRITSFILLDVQ